MEKHDKNSIKKDLSSQAKENLKKIDRERLPLRDDFIKWKGGKFKTFCKESAFVQSLFYYAKLDYFINLFSSSFKKEVESIIDLYLPEIKNNNKRRKEIKKLIYKGNRIAMLKPFEFFFYGLERNLGNQNFKSFVSDKYMLQRMSMKGLRRLHDVEINDKYNFFLLTKPFFKRNVYLLSPEDSLNDFKSKLKGNDKLIFKPMMLGCGEGVFIGNVNKEIEEIYLKINKTQSYWVAEELIQQSKFFASWNNSSVNTIRIISFNKNNNIYFTTSFLRTGRKGSVVDNAGLGGIFADIDDQTGIIFTDGIDERCVSYANHPESGLIYKGTIIPNWNDLKEIVSILHLDVFPKMPYMAWDFAHTEKDGWVLVEGNWGQFVNQAPTGIGLRAVFDEYVK